VLERGKILKSKKKRKTPKSKKFARPWLNFERLEIFRNLTLCSQASREMTLSSQAFLNLTQRHTNSSIQDFPTFSGISGFSLSFSLSDSTERTILPLPFSPLHH
jgi:hypothetical protein